MRSALFGFLAACTLFVTACGNDCNNVGYPNTTNANCPGFVGAGAYGGAYGGGYGSPYGTSPYGGYGYGQQPYGQPYGYPPGGGPLICTGNPPICHH
jgi:hypothetical protein